MAYGKLEKLLEGSWMNAPKGNENGGSNLGNVVIKEMHSLGCTCLSESLRRYVKVRRSD